jgi:hypothetical protein
MSKVHWIGDGNIQGWARTACGMSGMATPTQGHYDSYDGRSFEANYRLWLGVTCKRCLKNPHSPDGRVTAALSSHHPHTPEN